MIRRPEILRILLIDDDEIDRMAVIRGFHKANVPSEIEVAKDGIEALEILRDRERSRDREPYIVLLDLNMPRLDGIGFLEEIRDDDSLRRNIVFVLTTSDRDEDMMAAYDQQVAGYIVKKSCGRDYRELIQMLDTYWQLVAFPQN